MELKVQKRNTFGGSQSAVLRASGLVPAELYGNGVENVHLAVPVKDMMTAYKRAGESEIINLVVDGKTTPVLIHDVQFHPLSQEFQSVDFYQVNMNEELELAVPFEFVGEAPAIKNFGGILTKAMDEVEVKCLPANIPAHIKIDLSTLANLNQSIYVRDLPASDKYKIVSDPNNAIVSISEPMKEEEIVPAVEAKIEDIKVEGEEKVAARAAAKAAPATEAGAKKEVKK
jgi:large subunit ribosomal protein L25